MSETTGDDSADTRLRQRFENRLRKWAEHANDPSITWEPGAQEPLLSAVRELEVLLADPDPHQPPSARRHAR